MNNKKSENDSFFCYPKSKTDVVTKLAFAKEILTEASVLITG